MLINLIHTYLKYPINEAIAFYLKQKSPLFYKISVILIEKGVKENEITLKE